MQNLVDHIRKYVPLTNDEAESLPHWFQELSLNKKEFLLREGQVCTSRYFVIRGCLRMYFIKENGNEQIAEFAIENWWQADYMSLATKTSSSFYIQAIEDTQVLGLTSASAEDLFTELPQMERYFRLVIQRAYAAAQWRVKYLYDFSREELYHHFSTHFPAFVERVPQYMLASYLGFTPEYLSEIRKKHL